MPEIQYELRERDLIAFSEHEVSDSSDLQKQMRRHSAHIPGILGFIALFYFFFYEDMITAFYIAILAVSWGLLAPLYFMKDFRRQIRKNYSDEDLENLLGPYKLRAEKRTLVEISPQGETHIPWPEILRAELTKKYAFIYVDAHEALIVPVRKIKRKEIVQFIEAVEERIEACE